MSKFKNLLSKDLVMDRLAKHQTFDFSAQGTEGKANRPLSDMYPYPPIQQLILLLNNLANQLSVGR